MEQRKKINIEKDERKRDGGEANKQIQPTNPTDVNRFSFLMTQHKDSLHVRLIDDGLHILITSAL